MTKRKPKKKTHNQLLWEKEQQRIKRYLKSLEKKGFNVDYSIVPSNPTRVTQRQLENIRRLTAKRIRNLSIIKKPNRTQLFKKTAVIDRVILSNIRQRLRSFIFSTAFHFIQNREGARTLNDFIDMLIERDGFSTTAERAERNASTISQALDVVLMDSKQENINMAINEIVEALTGSILSADLTKELEDTNEYYGNYGPIDEEDKDLPFE